MRILLPVNASPGCKQTLDWVCTYLSKNSVELYLLNIIFWKPGTVNHLLDSAEAQHILVHYKDFFTKAGFRVVKTDYVFGLPAESICQYANQEKIDQIIMGAHSYRGVLSILMGSVTKAVFKEARQSVLVLNNSGAPYLEVAHPNQLSLISKRREQQHVLIPIDGSLGSFRTVEWVAGFLTPDLVQIHLLHIFNYSPVLGERNPAERVSSKIISEAESYLERKGFHVVIKEIQGSPSSSIRAYADQQFIDLIIIGSHGEQGPGQFLMGSVSRHVFEHAHQPVILINNSIEPTLKISQPEQVKITGYVTKP